MKKFFKSILVLLLILLPVTFASAKKTTKTTTTQAASAPSVVDMYIFYGDGCSHCAELEEYIKTSLRSDSRVKDIVRITYFETWYDTTNQQFLSAVSKELGTEIKGVPFILIGDQTFSGFGGQMGEDLVAKIIEQSKNNKYVDVIAKVKASSGITPVSSDPENKGAATETEKTDSSKNDIIGYVILGITVVIILIIIFTRTSDDDEDEDDDDDEEDESEDDEESDEDDDEDEDESEDEEEEKVVEEKKTNKKTATTKKKTTKRSTKKRK